MYINSSPKSDTHGNVSFKATSLIKKRSEEFTSQNKRLFSRFGKIWRIVFFTVLLILFCVTCYFIFLKNGYFNVSQTVFIDSNFKFIQLQSLEGFMDGYKDQNIFLLDTENIKRILKDRYPMSSKIIVDKKLPNTLTVSIKETNLKYSLICSDYVYNLDDMGTYVSKIKLSAPVAITDEDRDLLNGDLLISDTKLTTEELDRLKSEASNDSKSLLDEKIRNLKVEKYRQNYFDAFDRVFSKYVSAYQDPYNLYKIFSFNCGSYGENLSDYSNYKEYILSYSALRADENFNPLEVLELKYNRFVFTKNSKYFIFSSLESIEKQIRRYGVVKSNLEKEGSDFHVIDLTQEKVVVL